MSPTEPTFRTISDTAIWAAVYRARETRRAAALFRDPFAGRLAGERGVEIAAALRAQDRNEWAWVMRTVLFDRFIAKRVAEGADLVVNLAAGLDARPYRMSLPPTLRWVEVDLPVILDSKEQILRDEKPVCALERVRLDLTDRAARQALFQRLGTDARDALILTEGLLIYLSEPDVGALAQDLAESEGFRRWVLDMASPALLRMMQKQVGEAVDRAGAPFRFGPAEGPEFFRPFGWRPAAVESILRAAASEKRVPLWMRLLARLPELSRPGPSRIWSAVSLLEKFGEGASGPR